MEDRLVLALLGGHFLAGRFLGGRLAGQLELRARLEILHVVGHVIGAGQRLPAHVHLAPGQCQGAGQREAGQAPSQRVEFA